MTCCADSPGVMQKHHSGKTSCKLHLKGCGNMQQSGFLPWTSYQLQTNWQCLWIIAHLYLPHTSTFLEKCQSINTPSCPHPCIWPLLAGSWDQNVKIFVLPISSLFKIMTIWNRAWYKQGLNGLFHEPAQFDIPSVWTKSYEEWSDQHKRASLIYVTRLTHLDINIW